MLYLGTLSYSIYMVHALVFALAGNVYQYVFKLPVTVNEQGKATLDIWCADLINIALLIIVIAISALTYKYVEKPFRDRFRKLAYP